MIRQRILSSLVTPHRCLFTPLRCKSYAQKERERLRSISKTRALAQLDDFYGSIFLEEWPSIRLALLSPEKKGVVVNNFSDKEKVFDQLQNIGAYNVRLMFEEKQNSLKLSPENQLCNGTAHVNQIDTRIENALQRQQRDDLDAIFPEPLDPEVEREIAKSFKKQPLVEDVDIDVTRETSFDDPSKDTSLAESLKTADYDMNRLIIPKGTGITFDASLYDYIPTTKLKGMEDYIPESAHYSHFKENPEIPIDIQFEDEVEFPKLLDVFAFERGNCDTFEFSGRGSTNVLDYHILDLGVLAPVLALGLEEGDFVLDMTSSLLDVAMLISQSLIPAMFVANCEDTKKAQYLFRTLSSYIYNLDEDTCNVVITDSHPLTLQDVHKFDKIFVTVPSTFDRRSLNVEVDNMFSATRIEERIKLPEEQMKLLRKALQLVKVGGSVVYCTESLSPIQNDAVIQQVLEDLWNNFNSKFIVRDLTRGLEPLQLFMKITKSGKYGHNVVPFLPNNCGPLYFCKMVKVSTEMNEQ